MSSASKTLATKTKEELIAEIEELLEQ